VASLPPDDYSSTNEAGDVDSELLTVEQAAAAYAVAL
jgi:hypothetical protein